jgi:hypothetical protein
MDAFRNLFCGMQQLRKRALRVSAQTNLQVMSEPHIKRIGENASTAQRSDAPAKWIYGGIL